MTNVVSLTSIDALPRFWGKVASPRHVDECWVWSGSKSRDGYGLFGNGEKTERAHRFIFRMTFGPIGRGMVILHKCDNPSCVNPSHLAIGTQAENVADMRRKKRAVNVNGERHGRAKLTEAQVKEIRDDKRMQKEIAAAYGVSKGLIGLIKTRRVWAHI